MMDDSAIWICVTGSGLYSLNGFYEALHVAFVWFDFLCLSKINKKQNFSILSIIKLVI